MTHNPNNGNCPKTIVGDCGYEKCNPNVHPCTCEEKPSESKDVLEEKYYRTHNITCLESSGTPCTHLSELLASHATHLRQQIAGEVRGMRKLNVCQIHEVLTSEGQERCGSCAVAIVNNDTVDRLRNILNEELA